MGTTYHCGWLSEDTDRKWRKRKHFGATRTRFCSARNSLLTIPNLYWFNLTQTIANSLFKLIPSTTSFACFVTFLFIIWYAIYVCVKQLYFWYGFKRIITKQNCHRKRKQNCTWICYEVNIYNPIQRCAVSCVNYPAAEQQPVTLKMKKNG